MTLASEHELHALPWTAGRAGAHVARAALSLTAGQVEAGHGCPITMTFAAVPALRAQPELAAEWEPLLTAPAYDGELRPAAEKGSAKCGMAMTEKQGGSDVRANTTTATPLDGGGPGAEYVLRGHKWFCSAPMCDLFLILAQSAEGIGCFAVPRVLPDGTRNVFRLQRLKDKLGNRSNASSELELDGTWGRLVGEPGRGVRDDHRDGRPHPAGLRAGLGGRHALGGGQRDLAHRPPRGLRQAAGRPAAHGQRPGRPGDRERGGHGAGAAPGARLRRGRPARCAAWARPSAKFHVCKRFPMLAAEALECLGGNGYVEESGMPRLYREAPLNSVWEGSGNVNALDVLRALAREPAVLGAFLDEVELAAGGDHRLDAFVAGLRDELADPDAVEHRARRVVEGLALALQGSLLVRHAPSAVADAFCASRLGGDGGLCFGTLPKGADVAAIVARHTPPA